MARDLLWGWTLAEIHDLARSAALSNRWLVSDFTIRFEAAFDALIDELLTAECCPSRHDLQAAGKGAISRSLLKDFCHTYGVADRDLTAGIGSAPRFAAYWAHLPDDPWEDRIIDRIAVGQIMAVIGPRHVRFLEALAAAPDTRSAAGALGILRSSYRSYLSEARRAFEASWYWPEAPPKGRKRPNRYSPSDWNTSRKAPCGTHAAYERHKRSGDVCRNPEACKTAYSARETERHRARKAGHHG